MTLVFIINFNLRIWKKLEVIALDSDQSAEESFWSIIHYE